MTKPRIKPYKGYPLRVFRKEGGKGWYGVVGCDDLMLPEGDDAESLERDFREFVDWYLEICAAQGLTPKPPKGKRK
jgi:predicted HicB family RNase H-like nuclease